METNRCSGVENKNHYLAFECLCQRVKTQGTSMFVQTKAAHTSKDTSKSYSVHLCFVKKLILTENKHAVTLTSNIILQINATAKRLKMIHIISRAQKTNTIITVSEWAAEDKHH